MYQERKLILIRRLRVRVRMRMLIDLIYVPFVSMWNIQFGAFFAAQLISEHTLKLIR